MTRIRQIIERAMSEPFRDRHWTRHLISILAWRMRGYSVADYFVHPLYRAPRKVLSSKEYQRLEHQWNPKNTGIVAFDKWVQGSFFVAHGIPHPDIYGLIDHTTLIRDSEPGPLTAETLCDFLVATPLPAILKPVDYGMGRGVDMILGLDEAGGTLDLAGEGEIGLIEFVDRMRESDSAWIIQRRVRQHDVMARLSTMSVNTVRVVTHRYGDGLVRPVIAGARMGGAGSIVDNMAGGGLMARMDLETGRLDPAEGYYGDARVEVHPDTGCPITGLELPYWRDLLDLAVRAHHLILGPAHLGFDIAIEADGPCILEINGFVAANVNQRIYPEFFPRILNRDSGSR